MKKIIPNTITLINLLSGCIAIVCAFRGPEAAIGTTPGYICAFWFILLAATADFCDGLAARLLGKYSELGKQLDSLSDLVSFGVAPAMILLNLMTAAGAPTWAALCALLIPICGALRLARFNIDPEQSHTFRGLPIPANALFCIGLSALIASEGGANLLCVLGCILAVSLLMVCPVPMYSLKFRGMQPVGNIMRYLLVMIAAACLIVWGWTGLFYTVAYYVVSAFILALVRSAKSAE